MAVAAELYHPFVPPRPKPVLRSIEEAAAAVGRSEATIYRYLERGLLKRYYTTIGKRQTRVDMNELQHLVENPPAEPAKPKPPKPAE